MTESNGETAAGLDPHSTSAGPASGARYPAAALLQSVGMLAVLLILVAVFSLLSKNFLSAQTVVLIANRIPDLTVISIGLTLVLVIGGIDLSVGSLLALGSATIGVLMVDQGYSLPLAAAACLLITFAAGMINGTITVMAGIPSFIVTLGMLEIARGGAYWMTDSQTKYIGSPIEWISSPIAGLGGWGISPAFLLAIFLVVLFQWVLSRTVFGRLCVAIGTNQEAVRLSGIRDRPYRLAVFGISGLLCGVAALMQTSRLSTADPNAAIGLELAAIAACVIGGTSLMGGRGSVLSTFFGVLIIEVLQTGLAQVGAQDATKRIITGGVIILAVCLDAARARWLSGHGLSGRLASRGLEPAGAISASAEAGR